MPNYSYSLVAEILRLQAWRFLVSRQYASGELLLQFLLQQDWADPNSEPTLAYILLAQGKPEQALKTLSNTRRNLGGDLSSEYLRGIALARLGNNKKAKIAFANWVHLKRLIHKSSPARFKNNDLE